MAEPHEDRGSSPRARDEAHGEGPPAGGDPSAGGERRTRQAVEEGASARPPDGARGPERAGGGGEDIEELRRKAAERDEYLELLKRAKADFANYRKRVDEERKAWSEAAQRELLVRLLAAADQCRLAASGAGSDESPESLRDCIGLMWSEINRFLESVGVEHVPAVGERFDPDRHEAVFVQERDDRPDGTVVEELRAGYEFAGRVLRPAQVVVSKRPERRQEASSREARDSGESGPHAGERRGPKRG
jgi:molecular chaperone GrpE